MSSSSLSTIAFLTEISINDKVAFVKDVFERIDIWREDVSSFASCHPERSEGSGWPHAQILRCAQDDQPDRSHLRSREVFSPNIC